MPDTSPDLPAMSPLAAYRQAVEQRGFAPDEAQRRAAEALERCFQACTSRTATARSGRHLWGPVGRGKTWLMDHFTSACACPRGASAPPLHAMGAPAPVRTDRYSRPVARLARELARDVRVLCFDELFVSDIGDAILLGSLLRIVFEEGVVLVATSISRRSSCTPTASTPRTPPGDRGDPAALGGRGGWRPGPPPVPAGPSNATGWWRRGRPGGFAELFARLSAGEVVSAQPIELGHRPLAVRRHNEVGALVQLCAALRVPLSGAGLHRPLRPLPGDLMDDLPCLSASRREGRIAVAPGQRATLVEAGDRGAAVVGARRRRAALHRPGGRMLRPQGAALPGGQGYRWRHFMPRLPGFAFRRTLSRLREMQLARFGSDSAGWRRAAEAGTADGARSSAGQAEAQ
ncbi:AFG1/ZapE family ATPase [Pseudomonas aeruginosa]|nr:AFG1/ZapE family ATPase [Pseudomonas aeruginosa]